MAKKKITKTKPPAPPARNPQMKLIPVSQIKAAPYNPRADLQPGDPKWETLKRSVDRFGCVQPLVWNKRTGHLVGGHQRLKVMIHEYKVEKVNVSVVDLPLDAEKQLNLALNKVSGSWDDKKLAEIFAEMQTMEIDFEVTGFGDEEVHHLLEKFLDEHEEEMKTVKLDSPSGFSVQVDCDDRTSAENLKAWIEGKGHQCKLVSY